MRRWLSLYAFFCLFLFSCAPGPIYMVQTETEAIVKNYKEEDIQKKHIANEKLFNEIYKRFTETKKVSFITEGLGVMPVVDEKNLRRYYLKVFIRPLEVNFDVNTTYAEKRFSEIVYVQLPLLIWYIKKEDLKDFDGLAFGIYWPVRDFSQCKEHGGFIEYAHFLIPKEKFFEMHDKKKDMKEVLKESEIIISLDLSPAKSIRVHF